MYLRTLFSLQMMFIVQVLMHTMVTHADGHAIHFLSFLFLFLLRPTMIHSVVYDRCNDKQNNNNKNIFRS